MVRIVAFGVICELTELLDQYPLQVSSEDLLKETSAKPASYQPNKLPIIQQECDTAEPMLLHFSLEEFVDLSDGRRHILRADRGFSSGPLYTLDVTGQVHKVPAEEQLDMIWRLLTQDQLTEDVLATVESDNVSSWLRWVVSQLCSFGVEASISSLQAVPYKVEFGPLVLSKLEH